MSRMEDAKKKYESVPVPEELDQRIRTAIAQSEQKRKKQWMELFVMRTVKRSLATAAAFTAVFTLMVNTNTSFADTVSQIPVVGEVARLLTFRSFEEENKDMKLSIKVPALEAIEADTGDLSKEVNQEIYDLCLKYANEAKKRAAEYREAFLATGGTEEEWEAHNIEIKVDYELKSQTEDTISFVVRGTENWSSAYNEERYYNLDLANGTHLSLEDVLGEDYQNIVHEAVIAQIPQKEQETGVEFWNTEEGGFDGITEETNFYLNEAGETVVVFSPYEIAPGAAGTIEFVIR